MLFPQKEKYYCLRTQMNWGATTNIDKHGTNGWVNLSVINVSTESFLQYPDERA